MISAIFSVKNNKTDQQQLIELIARNYSCNSVKEDFRRWMMGHLNLKFDK